MKRAFGVGWLVLCASVGACSRPASDAPAGVASGSLSSASASAPAAPGVSAASAQPAASAQVAQAASGNDISVQQLADGRITLKTTTLWGAPVDTTYENCTFYRNALPVLKRQLSEDRGRVLESICPEVAKPAH